MPTTTTEIKFDRMVRVLTHLVLGALLWFALCQHLADPGTITRLSINSLKLIGFLTVFGFALIAAGLNCGGADHGRRSSRYGFALLLVGSISLLSFMLVPILQFTVLSRI